MSATIGDGISRDVSTGCMQFVRHHSVASSGVCAFVYEPMDGVARP